MSPDLDPAVEAAAREIHAIRTQVVTGGVRDWESLTESGQSAYADQARAILAAAAPLIRAQERAAVRAELLALEQAYRLEAKDHFGLEAYDLSRYAAVIRDAADNHVAPEHVTPREKP